MGNGENVKKKRERTHRKRRHDGRRSPATERDDKANRGDDRARRRRRREESAKTVRNKADLADAKTAEEKHAENSATRVNENAAQTLDEDGTAPTSKNDDPDSPLTKKEKLFAWMESDSDDAAARAQE